MTVVDAAGSPRLVGGRPWTYVHRVSRPTMTVYSPIGSNTGAAVVVFPGGAITFWRSISKARKSATG